MYIKLWLWFTAYFPGIVVKIFFQNMKELKKALRRDQRSSKKMPKINKSFYSGNLARKEAHRSGGLAKGVMWVHVAWHPGCFTWATNSFSSLDLQDPAHLMCRQTAPAVIFSSLDHHFGISPLVCQAHLVLRQDSFPYQSSLCIFKKDDGIKPLMPADALLSVMSNQPGYRVKGSHLFVL